MTFIYSLAIIIGGYEVENEHGGITIIEEYDDKDSKTPYMSLSSLWDITMRMSTREMRLSCYHHQGIRQ